MTIRPTVTITLLFLALALGACDRKLAGDAKGLAHLSAASEPPPASGASDAPAMPAPATAAPVSTALSAGDIAGRLLTGGFSLAGIDFSDSVPLTCDSNHSSADTWALHCHGQARDGDRGNRPAMVEIDLYDHDVDLDTISQPLKDHIAALHQEWALANTPDITVTDKTSGTRTKLPATCHQALGRHDSPAYCELMASPRILIITGVKPLHASTHSLSMSADNSKPDSAQDADHAADLALIVLGQINDHLSAH